MARWIELEYGGSLSVIVEDIESYDGGSDTVRVMPIPGASERAVMVWSGLVEVVEGG